MLDENLKISNFYFLDSSAMKRPVLIMRLLRNSIWPKKLRLLRNNSNKKLKGTDKIFWDKVFENYRMGVASINCQPYIFELES